MSKTENLISGENVICVLANARMFWIVVVHVYVVSRVSLYVLEYWANFYDFLVFSFIVNIVSS